MKMKFLILLTALATATSLAAKQNVVLILIDDLSHYGITAYGANKVSSNQGFFENVEIDTPRIDSLAKDGLRCDYAYAYPLCEPTRIALMSGKNNVRNYHHPKAQHSSDITFGDLFDAEGYETCVVGKWKQSRGSDVVSGKDYIFEFGWDEFCCFDVINPPSKRMIDPHIVENGTATKYKGINPETGRRYYGPDLFNAYALDFLERNQEKPFFLYYSMVLMHDEHTPTPDSEPKSVYDNFDVTTRGKYGHMTGDDRRYFPDMLAYMDKMVGKVLDKLDELELADDTLVILMGDNGTKECFSHNLPDGSVFVGNKGSNKENGIHIPLLLRAPGSIPAGSVYKGLVNLTDILPTMCEATGVSISDDNVLDGISFWTQAQKRVSTEHRESIYTWYNRNARSYQLEDMIEYAFNKSFKRYGPCLNYPEGRFFDLRTDPFEEAGDRKVKLRNIYKKFHSSGLKIENLTPEQKRAYDSLGKVLEAKKYVPVRQVQVRKGEAPFTVGQAQKLRCKVMPADASRRGVIWESDNPGIASVDKFGVVTPHRKGKATITAYSWDDSFPVATGSKDPAYQTSGIQDSVVISVAQ